MGDIFSTREIELAIYLRYRDHYCIGTEPAGNRQRPRERNWLFAATDALAADVATFKATDPAVPVKKAFYYAKVLKNLLNDKDEF